MTSFTDLTVREVQTRPVVAPLSEPVTTSVGTVTDAPLVLIDLVTEQGVTGHAYLFAYQSFALKPLSDLVRSLGELVHGDAVVPFEMERKLRARFTLLGGAKNLAGIAVSGIDMAAWDALARAADTPLVSLLGGTPRAVPAYKSLGMIRADDGPREAEKAMQEGYRAVKIKIGWPALQEDLAAIRSLRSRLPDEMLLMVDYNQSLSVTEAIRRGRVLESEGISWIEEPTRCDDFAGCARIAAELNVPIQLGENFSGPFDMEAAIRAEACDLLMPDIQQIGGVTGWLRSASLAQAAGKEVSSHIFIEFSSHVLPVTPTARWLEHLDTASVVLAEPFRVEEGTLTAPERPGAGIEWNQEAVERFAVR